MTSLKPIIAIDGPAGSGKSTVAKLITKKLDLFYADREIISQVARQYSLLEEDLESYEEKKASFWQS